MKIELYKPLATHELIVSNSWSILSIFSTRFYGVIAVMSGDEVITNKFTINLWFKIINKYSCITNSQEK